MNFPGEGGGMRAGECAEDEGRGLMGRAGGVRKAADKSTEVVV